MAKVVLFVQRRGCTLTAFFHSLIQPQLQLCTFLPLVPAKDYSRDQCLHIFLFHWPG